MLVEWKFTGDGVLAFAGGALALFGVWWSNRKSAQNLQTQLDADKRAREEQAKREAYATAAVLRSEIISIWEVDLRAFSAEMRKVPVHTGMLMAASGIPLPQAPRRYFPVFERCVDKVGLLNRETASLVVQFYKRVGELLVTWDQYNRTGLDVEIFSHIHRLWQGLEHGYATLVDKLSAESGGHS
jgi:hypothetical protein